VKSKFKGKILRNDYCNVIDSNSDSHFNLKFLLGFSKWVAEWESLNVGEG